MSETTPGQAAYEAYIRFVGLPPEHWPSSGPGVNLALWDAVAAAVAGNLDAAREPHAAPGDPDCAVCANVGGPHGVPQPAPDPDGQQRYIDRLHDLIRDMLTAYPGLATELPAFQDRAGQLEVHDTDGQPFSGCWADGDGPLTRPQPAPELASLATVMGLSLDQAAEVHQALQAVNVTRAAVAPELAAAIQDIIDRYPEPQPAPGLAMLADTWMAKYREYADASTANAAEPDYARAQRAIGVAYKKCAGQLRAALEGK